MCGGRGGGRGRGGRYLSMLTLLALMDIVPSDIHNKRHFAVLHVLRM